MKFTGGEEVDGKVISIIPSLYEEHELHNILRDDYIPCRGPGVRLPESQDCAGLAAPISQLCHLHGDQGTAGQGVIIIVEIINPKKTKI